MFASVCRRRLLRLRLRLLQIPSAAGANPSRPNPRTPLLSHGYSSAALEGGPVSAPCAATASYLVSCGLSPAAAAAAARKARIRSTARADAVRALFRSYGFTDADIAEIVRQRSVMLNLDPDRILRPKLDLFASLGMSPSKLATMPLLLTLSLDKHLVPCIQFLRGIIGTDGDICSAICRAPRVLLANKKKNMRPVVDTLRRLWLPEKSISKLIVMEMNVLTFPPDRVSQIVEDVKALGLVETDMGFPYAMRAFCRLDREACLRRMDLYRSFGVSEGELQKALVRQPTMLHISSESINKKLRFFLDELKLELSDVIGKPVLMTYSLEKCIIPRCAVLSMLMREGKIAPNINLGAALIGSTEMFSKRFVLRYAHDVPDVVKAFEGKITFEGFRDRDALVH